MIVFFPCRFAFKTKSLNAPRNEKPRSLKLRRHAARLIYLHKYLSSFPGATLADKIDVTDLNGILLNIIPNIWSKQAYVQGLDCEFIFF